VLLLKLKHGKFIIGTIITIILVALIVLALPGMWRFAIYLLRLFMPFVIAYVFSLAVNPLVKKLEKSFKIPRSAAALTVIILLIGGVGGIVSWVVYKIVSEIKTLYLNFPEIYDSIAFEIELIKGRLSGVYEILPGNIKEALNNIALQVSQMASDFINTKSMPVMSGAGSVAKAFPGIIVGTVVFILSSFFMISDFERVKSIVKKPFRQKTRDNIALLSEQIKKYIGAYIKAQGIIMSVVFIILFIGFSILDVKYALLAALGTALLDALPFFGSGAVLWPMSILSFISGNLKTGFGAIIIYVVIILTRQFIEPKIVSKNIGMNPLLTLMSMYLGFRLLSIGGMILGPVIMLLFISLYKAHIFDSAIQLLKQLYAYLKKHLIILKTNLKNFWESE